MPKEVPLYYTHFLQICVKSTEAKEAKNLGHLSRKERHIIAEKFCKRMWNQNKKEIIPQMHTLMYRAPLHQKQQKMDKFVSEKEQISIEALVEQYWSNLEMQHDFE